MLVSCMEKRKRSSLSSSKMQYHTEAYQRIEGRRYLISLSNNVREEMFIPFNNECILNACKELEPGITSHLKEVFKLHVIMHAIFFFKTIFEGEKTFINYALIESLKIYLHHKHIHYHDILAYHSFISLYLSIDLITEPFILNLWLRYK